MDVRPSPRGSVSDAAGRERRAVVIHPDDRKYGALLVGGQGTGKTSALLTFYKNDVEDRRHGADRDRPQVGAIAHLPAQDAARLRASGCGFSTSATRRSG